ncbi:MAG: hypothetical protein PHO53_01975 [Actinomycetota bacterium]|nr:hypothetical protein [Actinomycetota bacterium]
MRKLMRTFEASESAFTLVELIITLVLIVLFMGGVVVLVSQGFGFVGAHTNIATLNRQANNVMEKLEAISRGAAKIIDAQTSGSRFTFEADVDGDEVLETVEISASGSNLRVGINEGSGMVYSVVTSNLESGTLSFNYYSRYEHDPESEVTSSYNSSVACVRVSFTLTTQSLGEKAEKSYSRYIYLKIGPGSRE